MTTIRPVTAKDIPQIQSIAHETWMFTYRQIYSEAFIHNFLSQAYSTENLQRSLEQDRQNAKRSFLVAEVDHQVVGYAQTAPADEEAHELLRIYIQPKYQHQGIGKSFLQEFVRILNPLHRLFAWVEKENLIGKGFYEKNGFVAVEEMIETIEGKDQVQLRYELKILD